MLAETGKIESCYAAKMDFIVILISTYIFYKRNRQLLHSKTLTFRNVQKTFSCLNRVASKPQIVLYIPPCSNAFFVLVLLANFS